MKYLKLLLTLLVLSSGLVSCTDQNDIAGSDSVNRNVVNYQDFSLSADTVGLDTNVSGTIFVIGENDKPDELRVQIIAWVEIDSTDWAGVEFAIPHGWEVSGIVSDYPQGYPAPDEYTTSWQTEDSESEWHIKVDIGSSKYNTDITRGGKGTVFIELKPLYPEQKLPDSIDILAGVGSEGDMVAYPCYQIINVLLN